MRCVVVRDAGACGNAVVRGGSRSCDRVRCTIVASVATRTRTFEEPCLISRARTAVILHTQCSAGAGRATEKNGCHRICAPRKKTVTASGGGSGGAALPGCAAASSSVASSSANSMKKRCFMPFVMSKIGVTATTRPTMSMPCSGGGSGARDGAAAAAAFRRRWRLSPASSSTNGVGAGREDGLAAASSAFNMQISKCRKTPPARVSSPSSPPPPPSLALSPSSLARETTSSHCSKMQTRSSSAGSSAAPSTTAGMR